MCVHMYIIYIWDLFCFGFLIGFLGVFIICLHIFEL